MRAAVLAAALLAACSRGGGSAPATTTTAATPADATTTTTTTPAGAAGPVTPPPADAAAAPDLRADCERVLAHTWQLIGGDPDSDKLRGAKHERELAECMEHVTPAARDCVLAATAPAQLGPCEQLGR